MGWLDKLLGRKEETTEQADDAPKKASLSGNSNGTKPFAHFFDGLEDRRIGRYSDNNKTYTKTKSWYGAEDRFKEKAYTESFAALFDYLRDEQEDNVIYQPDGRKFTFTIQQGSKMVYGQCDGERITAHVPLALMEQPSTAVMRRLLELNYNLYYTRFSMNEEQVLCMIMDTAVNAATPNKLYYGLRELATKADRQDDLLLADFATLKPTDTSHTTPYSETALDIKYRYFRDWIQHTLQRVSELNQDSFSGSIAYMLLTLIYRIDFLLRPEAKLLSELEKINTIYWEKKDELPLIERNQMMKDAIRKLLDITRNAFAVSVYQSKGSFAITTPPPQDKMKESYTNANRDAQWYVENKYPDIALVLNEYGVLYNQYTYSMPKVITNLAALYMAVMHADYFGALGMKEWFYNPETKEFNKEAIKKAADAAFNGYLDKYTQLRWDNSQLKWDSLYEFGVSFTDQIAHLNLEVKR